MRHRQLGRSGSVVSEVGAGTWGLGGVAYGPLDERTALATLECAIERGISFFDTADFYGAGRSESLLGRLAKGRRQRVVIATKGGMLPHAGFAMPQNFERAYLRQALEASLKRLGTDYVDAYLLHSPVLQSLVEDPSPLDELRRLQREGKLASFGVSARSPADALRAIEELGVELVEVNFNLADQRARECGLLSRAATLGVGVVIRTPLAFGYLSGSLSGRETLADMDHRAKWPTTQRQRWAGAARHFAALAERLGLSVAQLALRYAKSWDGVSTVIPGIMTPGEAADSAAQGDADFLPGPVLDEVARIYGAHDYYDPTIKPPLEPREVA